MINTSFKQDLKDRYGVSLLGIKTDKTAFEQIQEKWDQIEWGYQNSSIQI